MKEDDNTMSDPSKWALERAREYHLQKGNQRCDPHYYPDEFDLCPMCQEVGYCQEDRKLAALLDAARICTDEIKRLCAAVYDANDLDTDPDRSTDDCAQAWREKHAAAIAAAS